MAPLEGSIRLIFDSPASGAWNMSLDEALLHGVANDTSPETLRFYQWCEPTLSLGYFQPAQDRKGHLPSSHCKLVRRSSGGGAILHEHELTYSLCVRTSDRFSSGELYHLMHQSLISILQKVDVAAELFDDNSASQTVPTPFLCFERRSTGDVVCRGAKICGSAQRRQMDAVLQHGSLLFRQSVHAPELPGIEDLTQKRLKLDEVSQNWATAIDARVPRGLEPPSSWKQAEIDAAQLWQARRFSNDAWTFRR